MHNPSNRTVACPACGAELERAADQCHRCGRTIYADATARPDAPSPATDRSTNDVPKPAKPRRSMIDNPWFVLGLLFFATAACGLPLLWKSRGFSRLGKVILSIVVTLYTAVLLWGFWLIVQWSWTRIVNSL